MRLVFILFFLMYGFLIPSASQTDRDLYEAWEEYREESITTMRFKHGDVEPLLLQYAGHPEFTLDTAGYSVEGRPIYHLRYGEGPAKVLLWSQMHGDEPTATMAIVDILRFLVAVDRFDPFRDRLSERLTLHFIPLLNPDGAEVFQRRNSLGIDLNRDALRLICPESRILKEIRDDVSPQFGFNLHDQNRQNASGLSGKPASISFLAPAYDHARSINGVRAEAMLLIAEMDHILQKYIPGEVAKYDDTFEPRAFGDNIQRWGTSTILIESGGNLTENSKQALRKVHFMLLLSAFESIASGHYRSRSLSDYDRIPPNRRLMADLLICNGMVENEFGTYRMDVAVEIRQGSIGRSIIRDLGDLSVYAAYDSLDATGMTIRAGKVYPETFRNLEKLYKAGIEDLLREGYLVFRMKHVPSRKQRAGLPFLIDNTPKTGSIKPGQEIPLWIGNEERQYALVNGRVFDLVEWSYSEE